MAGAAPQDRRKLWYGLLSIALAAVLLYYALRGVEWARVWNTIVQADGVYLAAATYFPLGTVFNATMAGYLGNSFLPARAGEFVRTYIISSRSSLSKTYVLTTALSERMVDAITL